MKVKQVPDDFLVDEKSSIRATNEGRYAVYRLKKNGMGTLEALRAISRAWKTPSRVLGFGGLKDRYAVTTQWVTIPNGPHKNLDNKAFRLTYEGKSDVPMSRMILEGNGFRIRLRDLAREEADRVTSRFAIVAKEGLPSYFDEQRFGSLRGGGGFAALHLLKGDPESALRAVIASPSREDRAHVRERKRRIRAHWGEFDGLPEVLEGTPMRAPVLHYLQHPGDWLGAFATLDREDRRLYTSAYASSVWNRAVSTLLRTKIPLADQLVFEGVAGPLVFPRLPGLLHPFSTAVIPLPAPTALAEDPELQAALEASLAIDGIKLADMKLDKRLGMDFRPTKRDVVFRPTEATISGPHPDELNPGRTRVDLAFTLGRGLYATIILKFLTHDVPGPKSFK